MKKALSILLSLVLLLGSVSCLFTMPAAAEETETASTAETLPDSILKNSGFGPYSTIEPTTVIDTPFVDGCAAYVDVNGWNSVAPGKSYLLPNVPYQFNFTVTVSEDVNAGVKLYPAIQSQLTHEKLTNIHGIRYEGGNYDVAPTAAYNYGAGTTTAALGADNAATLEAGKTYNYSYVFTTTSSYVNIVAVFVDGLTDGTVTLSAPTVFSISDSFVGQFTHNQRFVPHLIEEDGNVYGRLWGYRAIGDTETVAEGKPIARTNGDLYGFEFKAGYTYNTSFDFRVMYTEDTTRYTPHYNWFLTNSQNYADDYAAVLKSAGTTDSETLTFTGGGTFDDTVSGYSYFYSADNSLTRNRRVKQGLATFKQTQNGQSLYTSPSTTYGSGAGRDAKTNIYNKGWVKTEYGINAMGQTLVEAATAGASNNVNSTMRYTYSASTGEWSLNNESYKSYYVPAAEDESVAFGMRYIYSGGCYDFDNFTIVESGNNHKVVDTDGNEVNSKISTSATSTFDCDSKKTTSKVEFLENDVYSFKGWYYDDTLISAERECVLDGLNFGAVPVIETKDVLSYLGGFENYTATTTNLEATYKEVSTTTYPKYTGTTFRYYPSIPTDDKWTGWDTNARTAKLSDSDNGVTVAKIQEDIAAAGGYIDTVGVAGFTYFPKFPTVVGPQSNVVYYVDQGKHADSKRTTSVTPYAGDRMLQYQASTRTGFALLDNLQPGKSYELSFYVYNISQYNYLRHVSVVTHPRYLHASATSSPCTDGNLKTMVLDQYSLPTTTGTVTYIDANGNKATKSNVSTLNEDQLNKWVKVTLDFIATDEVAYLAMMNQNYDYTGGYSFIDEITVIETEAKTEWDFEDGDLTNVACESDGVLSVVDAVDQAEKIGSKYLQATTTGWQAATFSFPYDSAYRHVISFDLKVFTYGTGNTSNGITLALNKFDNGLYGVNPQTVYGTGDGRYINVDGSNYITRYWENGNPINCSAGFMLAKNEQGECVGYQFYGRESTDGVYGEMGNVPEIWNEWQHFEIEIGTEEDFAGAAEFSIRANDAGWVIGIDNFKVTTIAASDIAAADAATNGTTVFNIRSATEAVKQGLRFKSTIDLNCLDSLGNGAKVVEYGTIAYKASYANNYVLRREVAKDRASDGVIVAGVAYNREDGTDVRYALDEETNILTYTGVLTGISVKNYDVDYSVRGYVIIEDANGNRTTVYDDVKTISVYDAAQVIINENKNADDVAAAQAVVTAYDEYLAAQQ